MKALALVFVAALLFATTAVARSLPHVGGYGPHVKQVNRASFA